MASSRSIFNIERPQSASQWIILLAVTGVVLTSPFGGRVIVGAIREYFTGRARAKKIQEKLDSKNISIALYKLKKRKIIQLKKMKDDRIRILLTEKGRIRKLAYDLEKIRIPKPQKWDGQWRFLIFDIPEKARFARDTFRERLRQLGFIQFQQSVWIYPYPCENEIDFLAENLRISRFLTLLTVRIKNDEPLRTVFKKFKLY